MAVINQSNGVNTEVEADSWCLDGLMNESCAAIEGPVIEVVAGCEDRFVIGPQDGFTPLPVDELMKLPEELGRVWSVVPHEGTVLVRTDGSGRWNKASWTFELTRPDRGCREWMAP